MKTITLAAIVAAVALTGCASILNDKTQKINVSASNGAEIKGTVNGQPFAGPGIVEVTRENKDKLFVTETAGCTKEVLASKSVDTKFWINILTGGVFGSSTDYGTQKMWKYDDHIVIPCK
jgi:hypothetical protein